MLRLKLLAKPRKAEVSASKLPLARSPAAGADSSLEIRRLGGEVFRTKEGKVFVKLDMGRRDETMPIHSERFRLWLSLRLQVESGKPPSRATLTSWINRLEAHAALNGPVADVHVRAAVARGLVHLDPCHDRWAAIEISPDWWNTDETAS